ncbi:hypothetical protein ACFSJW_14235 [Flavobacterium artemisiae]|uniref:Uncharacterized protein n=1 Tax=Flavobacterium artemisiae TaxID=2126556 RepID=A0ABW4HI40_9FLAO
MKRIYFIKTLIDADFIFIDLNKENKLKFPADFADQADKKIS